MAHEISVNSKGQAEAVFGYGEKPWWTNVSMPAIVLPDAVSFDQIFTIAFPWQAVMEQLQYSDGSLSAQYGIRRSDTLVELGVHSGNYGNIQPRMLFNFCAAFFQAYPEIPIASAIAMQGGRVLNISARIGEINVLGSGDIHRSYLSFVNSFNGAVKAQVYKSYVRAECMNTTRRGLATADFKMEYKHTKHVEQRINADIGKAQQLMLQQQATDKRVQEILEKLAQRRLSKTTYVAIMDDLFGDSNSTKRSNIKREVTALFADNDNNAFPEWAGTAYALFNAVTNYVDHDRTVRLTDGRAGMSEQQIRFESSQIGEGAKLKERALERILVMSDGSEAVESTVYSVPSVVPTVQPVIEVVPTPVSESTAQSEPEQGDMPIYTTADVRFDLDGTATLDVVEKVSDGVFVRLVQPMYGKHAAQVTAYKAQGCLAASFDEWQALQAQRVIANGA